MLSVYILNCKIKCMCVCVCECVSARVSLFLSPFLRAYVCKKDESKIYGVRVYSCVFERKTNVSVPGLLRRKVSCWQMPHVFPTLALSQPLVINIMYLYTYIYIHISVCGCVCTTMGLRKWVFLKLNRCVLVCFASYYITKQSLAHHILFIYLPLQKLEIEITESRLYGVGIEKQMLK